MLSKRIAELPEGEGWIFEPKWDGFRALIFRDGEEILIQSRDEKPLNRYFPELLDPIREQLPARCVLDGEIVIAINGRLEFEALQLRLHPAASRVKLLAQQTPASIVFFDLLCQGDRDLRGQPFEKRRRELEWARRKIHAVFADLDLVITPTIPVPAPSIAELRANPDALRPAELKLLRNTRPFNVWGLPVISLPCGFTQSGLPIGLQIAGPHWREDVVLRLAYAYEQATTWHKRECSCVNAALDGEFG